MADEPYQRFQFAGRADLLSWDLDRRALLHVENRTRFPNIQEAIGSFNAKRRYLPAILAERLNLRGGWASVANVMVGLWSSEVIHTVRIRSATFRAVCPDDDSTFSAWWTGAPLEAGGWTSSFVMFDPSVEFDARRRPFVGLRVALDPSTRPRFRGYADAAAKVRS